MTDPALTPALALDYLDELSTDIRGAVVLDADRRVVAAWRGDADRAERLREPLSELLEHADAFAGAPGSAAQIEVTTQRGAVFCVTDSDWTLAVVTGRFALPSLVFYDLRHVLEDLEGASA
jgi:predicted regulator of Ras-like GTPase activity (Roadblock/LC7/MglB family)